MTALMLTDHASVRMAQRGIALKDADLIVLIGTEVDDGYLVRAQDRQRIEQELKKLMNRIRRLQGKRLVIAENRVVTAYHATRRQGQRLLRRAHQSDLKTTWA